MELLWGVALVAAMVAVFHAIGRLAVRLDRWLEDRRHRRAMDRVASRLRCSPACRGGHTWSWPCERSPMADRRGRAR